ncbi:zinc finger and SCAN domain-containing protein 2 [Hippoglossus stenolepis]|uniref:zinc finger and SCAN domain-containing protein 2 n=1 Tax=Hippoglossus stenolepis TaxID=195615 RepID=UPI00159CA768|nr:zinc finger and SCAN domain-containing protein 2 [Hippoglossus stenolepis]
MDGVSWSTTRTPESFSRSTTATDTLSRLASFIARADTKQPTQTQRQRSSHLHAYVCPECGKSFPYATDLLHHQELKHSLPKPHRCPSCGQEFSLRSSLQLHKCDGDSSPCELCCGESRRGSPCPSCTHHTSDPGRPQENSLHLLDSSPYACAPCGRGFSQKQALLQHQQAGCSEPPSPSDGVDASSLPDDSPPVSEGDTTRSDSSDTPGPSSRAVRVCQFCSRSFRTEAGLQRHKRCNHSEEQSMAPKRQKTKGERTGGEMRKEEDDNEDPNKNSKSKKKFLKCRSCDMVFRSTSKLYMHRKEKHSREKSTRRDPKPVVKRRWRGHGNPCKVCGKVFFHHLSLKAHYRWHTTSSVSSLDDKGGSEGSTAKDGLPEKRPNNVKADLKDTTVKPGRGRPRKVPSLEIKEIDVRRCKEVPEVKEGEAEEEDEEEEEEREFPCPSCAEVFSLQSKLWEHMELHQSCVKRRHCSVCTNEMDTCKWPGSKRHRLYHCVPCQQGFSAMDSFLEHCQEHLRVRVEEDSLTEAYMQQARKV